MALINRGVPLSLSGNKYAALLIATLLFFDSAGRDFSAALGDEGYERAVARVTEATAVKQRHQSMGVNCAGCHGPEQDFSVVPPMDVCLKCHESYDAVAARTADVVPNPHHSHMDEVTCTDCHSEHQEPRVSCNQCHEFQMSVP